MTCIICCTYNKKYITDDNLIFCLTCYSDLTECEKCINFTKYKSKCFKCGYDDNHVTITRSEYNKLTNGTINKNKEMIDMIDFLVANNIYKKNETINLIAELETAISGVIRTKDIIHPIIQRIGQSHMDEIELSCSLFVSLEELYYYIEDVWNKVNTPHNCNKQCHSRLSYFTATRKILCFVFNNFSDADKYLSTDINKYKYSNSEYRHTVLHMKILSLDKLILDYGVRHNKPECLFRIGEIKKAACFGYVPALVKLVTTVKDNKIKVKLCNMIIEKMKVGNYIEHAILYKHYELSKLVDDKEKYYKILLSNDICYDDMYLYMENNNLLRKYKNELMKIQRVKIKDYCAYCQKMKFLELL